MAAAVLLAGCGNSAALRTERAAQAGFRSYLAAVRQADYTTACADSTPGARAQLVAAAVARAKEQRHRFDPRSGCAPAMRFVVAQAPGTARIQAGFDDLVFTGGHLSGASATVDFRIEKGAGRGTGTMRWTSGRWLMQHYSLGVWAAYARPRSDSPG